MSNLIALFSAAGSGLDAFQQALSVTQNNVSNSSTPGFATQSVNLQAQPFDIASGLAGGVAASGLVNSRNQYAEESVQCQSQLLGRYTAQAQSTGTIQSFFDVSGSTGLTAALNSLFQAFSSWSTTPTDTTARQTVISSATDVATAFQQLAGSLSQTSQQIDTQIGTTVAKINSIAAQIQQYNVQKLQNGQTDPAADAQLYSSLQTLSGLTDFSTVTQSDGTVTVMLSGGAPLVIGQQADPLSVSDFVDTVPAPVNPQSPPTAHILDSEGNDVTSQITGGQLGGLLDTRNRLLASYLGDSQQQGSLNQLAQGLADTVNSILKSGTVSSDAGAAAGSPLFTYSSSDPTDIAGSLAVSSSITPDQLAPVDSSGNSNGNANALAALSSSSSIQGMSYVQFYGQMAASVGQENSDATSNEQTQTQVLAQAESLRDQASGVSLDKQAVQVLEFQRAYQASAQVLTVLNDLAETTLNMLQTS